MFGVLVVFCLFIPRPNRVGKEGRIGQQLLPLTDGLVSISVLHKYPKVHLHCHERSFG